MVDDEVDRHQRIDLFRIAAERPHGIAHRGEIDHRRHAGEILHQDARRPEGDLAIGFSAVSQAAMARMSSTLTVRPFSLRTRFSRSTLSENGSREMSPSPSFSASGRLK